MNPGHGNSFFYKSVPISQNSYDYLLDFEEMQAYLANSAKDVDIWYNDAYIGGSSLKITFRESN